MAARGSEGRASEISVNEHAGGVDYGLKAGVGEFAEAFLGGGFDFFAAVFFVGEEELAGSGRFLDARRD